jgi:ElaB/YqjD/DUF883 family membrane-anchored ribosome-binding protein
MKTPISLVLAVLALAPAQAEIFRPEATSGALFGAIAGAIIGNNSGSLNHNTWQGAAIGAGTGFILGSIAGESNARQQAWSGTQVPVPAAPRYVYRRAPAAYATSRPGYSGLGMFLGGVAGAIIGHNSGSLNHNGWQGAAIGAGTGLLLGSMAGQNARIREAAAPVVVQSAPVSAPAGTSPNAAPQPVTIINNYYGNPSPMAAANTLFGR